MNLCHQSPAADKDFDFFLFVSCKSVLLLLRMWVSYSFCHKRNSTELPVPGNNSLSAKTEFPKNTLHNVDFVCCITYWLMCNCKQYKASGFKE